VALCGGTPNVFQAMTLYLKARCLALPSTHGARLHKDTGWALLSDGCFATALTALVAASPGFALLRALQMAGVTRRFVIPAPLLSQAALGVSRRHAGFALLQAAGDAPALSALYDAACLRACADLGQLVALPDAVRHDGFFTRSEFRRGATRLGATDSTPQPEDDFLHGNAEYGRHVLQALVTLL
jgi:hypothetical protein